MKNINNLLIYGCIFATLAIGCEDIYLFFFSNRLIGDNEFIAAGRVYDKYEADDAYYVSILMDNDSYKTEVSREKYDSLTIGSTHSFVVNPRGLVYLYAAVCAWITVFAFALGVSHMCLNAITGLLKYT